MIFEIGRKQRKKNSQTILLSVLCVQNAIMPKFLVFFLVFPKYKAFRSVDRLCACARACACTIYVHGRVFNSFSLSLYLNSIVYGVSHIYDEFMKNHGQNKHQNIYTLTAGWYVQHVQWQYTFVNFSPSVCACACARVCVCVCLFKVNSYFLCIQLLLWSIRGCSLFQQQQFHTKRVSLFLFLAETWHKLRKWLKIEIFKIVELSNVIGVL